MVAGSQIMQTADGQTVICQPSAGQAIPAQQPQVIQIGGQGEASEPRRSWYVVDSSLVVIKIIFRFSVLKN